VADVRHEHQQASYVVATDPMNSSRRSLATQTHNFGRVDEG